MKYTRAPGAQNSAGFDRIELKALFSNVTELKLSSDNCILCRDLTPLTTASNSPTQKESMEKKVSCSQYDTKPFSIFYREQPIDYGELDSSIRTSCTKMGLEDVDGKRRR